MAAPPNTEMRLTGGEGGSRSQWGSPFGEPWCRTRVVKHRRPQLISVFYGRFWTLPEPHRRSYNVMRG